MYAKVLGELSKSVFGSERATRDGPVIDKGEYDSEIEEFKKALAAKRALAKADTRPTSPPLSVLSIQSDEDDRSVPAPSVNHPESHISITVSSNVSNSTVESPHPNPTLPTGPTGSQPSVAKKLGKNLGPTMSDDPDADTIVPPKKPTRNARRTKVVQASTRTTRSRS